MPQKIFPAESCQTGRLAPSVAHVSGASLIAGGHRRPVPSCAKSFRFKVKGQNTKWLRVKQQLLRKQLLASNTPATASRSSSMKIRLFSMRFYELHPRPRTTVPQPARCVGGPRIRQYPCSSAPLSMPAWCCASRKSALSVLGIAFGIYTKLSPQGRVGSATRMAARAPARSEAGAACHSSFLPSRQLLGPAQGCPTLALTWTYMSPSFPLNWQSGLSGTRCILFLFVFSCPPIIYICLYWF